MNALHIRFTSARSAQDEQMVNGNYGQICKWLEDESGKEVRRLIDIVGEFAELANWLRTNRSALLGERLPTGEAGFSSVAEAVARFYDHLDPQADTSDMIQRVYDYRTSHSLRFSLRGTDVRDIYLGLFGGGYEVSFWGEKEHWKHAVNLPLFLDEAERL
jgi:hypothetical protein